MASSYQSDSNETTLYVPGQGAYKATLRASWSESNVNVNNNTTDITVTGYIYNGSAAYNSSDGAKMYVYWHDNKTGTNREIPGSPLTVSQMGDGSKTFYGSKSLTGTITVEHNADGTASGYAYVVWDKLKTYNLIPDDGSVSTSNHELYTIPRKSSISLDSTTKTTGQTLTVTITKASSGFTSTVRWAFGNQSGIIGTAKTSATSVTWSIPASVLTEIPNAPSGTGTITCETFNGDTSLGSVSSSITIQAASSVTPTISSSSISDGNSKWSNVYVQSKSFLVAAISASGVQGSTITQYRVSMDGIDYNGATVAEVNTKLRNAALVPQTSKTITIRVTDSRGRYKEATKTINVYAYTAPSITDISVFRSNASRVEDGDGTYATCAFKASVSSCNSNNRMQIKIYWKIYGATTYPSGNVTTIQSLSNNPQSIDKTSGNNRPILSNITTDHSWTIKIEVVDDFETTYIERDVSTGFDLIHFHTNGKSVAFGKKSEAGNNDKWFEVRMDNIKFDGTVLVNGIPWSNSGIESMPLGSIVAYPANVSNVPSGWTICDGKLLSRTEYAELFGIIGTTFGSGDGSTTFAIPDIRGRTIVGVNVNETEFTSLNTKGGEKSHKLLLAETPKHSHTKGSMRITGQLHYVMFDDGYSPYGEGALRFGSSPRTRTWNGASGGPAMAPALLDTDYGGWSGSTSEAGSDGYHNNLQPYISLNYIIKISRSNAVVGTVVDSMSGTSHTDAPSINAVKQAIQGYCNDIAFLRGDGTTPERSIGTAWQAWKITALTIGGQHGSGLTADGTNQRIIINRPCTMLRISASYNWYHNLIGGDHVLHITKTGAGLRDIGYFGASKDYNYYQMISGTCIVTGNFVAGDYIEARVSIGATGTEKTFSGNDNLIVEIIE